MAMLQLSSPRGADVRTLHDLIDRTEMTEASTAHDAVSELSRVTSWISTRQVLPLSEVRKSRTLTTSQNTTLTHDENDDVAQLESADSEH